MHVVEREVSLAQLLEGGLGLASPRAASSSFGVRGCWRRLKGESAERRRWMEDREELPVLSWEYLGDIRYVFVKK